MDSNFLIGLLIITGFFAIFGFVLWLCFRGEEKRKNAELTELNERIREQKERHKKI